MQEKPLLTQLQSAYPTNSIIDVFFFKKQKKNNKKHEFHTISPEGNNPVYNTNCMNFVLPHFCISNKFP